MKKAKEPEEAEVEEEVVEEEEAEVEEEEANRAMMNLSSRTPMI